MVIPGRLLDIKNAIASHYFSRRAPGWVRRAASLLERIEGSVVAGVGIEYTSGGYSEGDLDVVLYLRRDVAGLLNGASVEIDIPGPGEVTVRTRVTGPFRPASFSKKIRPALAGYSIGPRSFERVTGTFGAVVHAEAQPDTWLILTCNHVATFNDWDVKEGHERTVLQPAAGDDPSGIPNNAIAIADRQPMQCRLLPAGNQPGNYVTSPGDYGFLRVPNHAAVSLEWADPQMPALVSAKPLSFAEVNQNHWNKKVCKTGCTTGYTTGKMKAPSANFRLHYTEPSAIPFNLSCNFKDTILVSGVNGKFADDGDSGSLVVTEDGYPVGLLFAVNGQNEGVVCPLDKLFEDLGMSFVLP